MSTTTPAAAQVGVAAPPKLEKKPVKFSNLLRMSFRQAPLLLLLLLLLAMC